jgi:hypothetical protein
VLWQLHRERFAVRTGVVVPRHDDLYALGSLRQRQDREREPIPRPQRGWGLLQFVEAVEHRRIIRTDWQHAGPDLRSRCRAVVGEHELQGRGRAGHCCPYVGVLTCLNLLALSCLFDRGSAWPAGVSDDTRGSRWQSG